MKRTPKLIFALLAQVSSAVAEGALPPAAITTEAGIVCPPEPIGTEPAPNTLAGTTYVIADDPAFVSHGRQVPAVLGVGFGVKSRPTDGTDYLTVTIVLTHPKMGDAGVTVQSYDTQISSIGPSLAFFQFDHPYELVKGRWTFTAKSENAVLYSIDFEVVDPAQVPNLADICRYSDLLS